MVIMSAAWLRDDVAFIKVEAVARFFSPMSSNTFKSSNDLISDLLRPSTKTFPARSLMDKERLAGFSKSPKTSQYI